MQISLGLVSLLLLVAVVGILTQHGHATRITWLSLVPLGVYLLYWAVCWLVNKLRK